MQQGENKTDNINKGTARVWRYRYPQLESFNNIVFRGWLSNCLERWGEHGLYI